MLLLIRESASYPLYKHPQIYIHTQTDARTRTRTRTHTHTKTNKRQPLRVWNLGNDRVEGFRQAPPKQRAIQTSGGWCRLTSEQFPIRLLAHPYTCMHTHKLRSSQVMILLFMYSLMRVHRVSLLLFQSIICPRNPSASYVCLLY